jgi:hypothetical protein
MVMMIMMVALQQIGCHDINGVTRAVPHLD